MTEAVQNLPVWRMTPAHRSAGTATIGGFHHPPDVARLANHEISLTPNAEPQEDCTDVVF